MPTACEIEFENNPLKAVYSGQLLRDNVNSSLNEWKKVRGVFINICVKAFCHWRKGSGRSLKVCAGRGRLFG